MSSAIFGGSVEPFSGRSQCVNPKPALTWSSFSEVPGTECPCGTAHRAFDGAADFPATVHVTDISIDAKLHFHKRLAETYYFLECEPGAQMQLGDEIVAVAPGTWRLHCDSTGRAPSGDRKNEGVSSLRFRNSTPVTSRLSKPHPANWAPRRSCRPWRVTGRSSRSCAAPLTPAIWAGLSPCETYCRARGSSKRRRAHKRIGVDRRWPRTLPACRR